jgi:hypothetical protein
MNFRKRNGSLMKRAISRIKCGAPTPIEICLRMDIEFGGRSMDECFVSPRLCRQRSTCRQRDSAGRLPHGRVSGRRRKSTAMVYAGGMRIANPRYGRLPVCATWSRALSGGVIVVRMQWAGLNDGIITVYLSTENSEGSSLFSVDRFGEGSAFAPFAMALSEIL